MKSKGFTLIEVVGVIVILGILGVIVLPIIIGVITENGNTIDEAQERLIKDAAKSYVSANLFKDVSCVNVSTLMDEGYLEKVDSIKRQTKDDIDPNDYKVVITTNVTPFEYKVEKGKC